MAFLLSLVLICLATIAEAQMKNLCGDPYTVSTTVAPTAVSCTLFFTPFMPPQIPPTSTVYKKMMTTQLNIVNCNYCQVSNVGQNPLATGRFTAKVVSEYLYMTEVACIASTSSLIRGYALPEATPEPTVLMMRGAQPQQTFTPVVKKNALALPTPVNYFKRQAAPNLNGNPFILTGEASRLMQQLFTVTYAVGVINTGADLDQACLQLRSANAMLDLARIGLNASQAADIVCIASRPESDLNSFNLTLIASAAAGLYSVQIAANYSGTVSAATLCKQIDLSPLPELGVDVAAVKRFICGAKNATTNTPATATTVQIMPSAGTLTALPFTNSTGGSSTWFGSGSGSGSVGTAVTTPWGTGFPAAGTGFFPISNSTAVAGASGLATASVGAGTGLGSAGFGTGTTPKATSNNSVGASSVRSGNAAVGTAPFPTGTGNISEITGNSGSGSVKFASAPFPTGAANISAITRSAGLATGAVGTAPFPTGPANISATIGSTGIATGARGTAPFPTGPANVSAAIGSAGRATGGRGTAPFPTGAANISAIMGSTGHDTAVLGTAPHSPAGSGSASAIAGSGQFGTVALPTGTANVSQVAGRPAASTPPALGTGAVPAGTGSVGNGTAVVGSGNRPAGTGNVGAATSVNGTGHSSLVDVVGGTVSRVSVTVEVSVGYSSSATSSRSSLASYGAGASEHVPRGPTSTPRYYPKYF